MMITEVEFARRVAEAKRLLPKHRRYLDELLRMFMLLTPQERKSIFIDRGYGDPYYIRFVRTKDRDSLLKMCRDAVGEKDVF
tara:strand:- start:7883 stop:8128 length:246 start_codon:yes stop_codon:yes gene_type:complete